MRVVEVMMVMMRVVVEVVLEVRRRGERRIDGGQCGVGTRVVGCRLKPIIQGGHEGAFDRSGDHQARTHQARPRRRVGEMWGDAIFC